MAIYTRTGDKGKTSLFNKKRVSKTDVRVEAYGTVDELNSTIGVVLSEIRNPKSEIRNKLEKIQNDLLNIGSNLASPTPNHEPSTMNYLRKRIKEFEDSIDKMTLHLPKLSNFILPGGGRIGSMLHLARAVCRRAERRAVALNNKERIDDDIIIYLNRLSDLLFIMSRFANFKEKKKEMIWAKQ